MKNDDFRKLYEQLCTMYQIYNLKPGILEHIGYTGCWTTVDASRGQRAMAFNFSGEHAVHGIPQPQQLASLQPYIGRELFALAERLLDTEEIMLRSCCQAALIALSNPLNQREALQSRNLPLADEENYAFIRPGDKVAVVGYGRVTGPLLERQIPYDVCDLRPAASLGYWSIGERSVIRGPQGVAFHSPEEHGAVLAAADVVLITGCTMTNGTLEGLIGQTKQARVIGLFGPSAGVVPEFLLQKGVNYILSSRYAGETRLFDALLGQQNMFNAGCESYIIEDLG
ncbi:MAG: DUF364 domain-containing protein [Clostridiales bacterium]